jgi:hypothetical protein
VPGGALVEGRWRQAYQQAGSGELGALRAADPGPVEEDSAVLGAALRRVLDRLPDGGRAPVVGLSPTNEAAVLGLTRTLVEPMAKGPESLSSPTERTRGSSPAVERRPPPPKPVFLVSPVVGASAAGLPWL